MTGFSRKAKIRMLRGAQNLEKANTSNPSQPKSCRICLGDENEEDNELISPCKCAGTMRHIHLKCLQEWLGGKKSVRELPFSTIYLYRMASCELCKVNFPGNLSQLIYKLFIDHVKEKNKKIEIFKI
jgi:E3 ubiquitin-protein ligase DOA10